MCYLVFRSEKVKLNVKNTQAGQLNNDRYDDVLENTDSVLPEEISDDENNGEEEGGEDAGDEDSLDNDNYGLGIGNDFVLDTPDFCADKSNSRSGIIRIHFRRSRISGRSD